MTRAEAHRILGVGDNPTPDEIDASYKRLIRQLHPDMMRRRGASEIEIESAGERSSLINEARTVAKLPMGAAFGDTMIRTSSRVFGDDVYEMHRQQETAPAGVSIKYKSMRSIKNPIYEHTRQQYDEQESARQEDNVLRSVLDDIYGSDKGVNVYLSSSLAVSAAMIAVVFMLGAFIPQNSSNLIPVHGLMPWAIASLLFLAAKIAVWDLMGMSRRVFKPRKPTSFQAALRDGAEIIVCMMAIVFTRLIFGTGTVGYDDVTRNTMITAFGVGAVLLAIGFAGKWARGYLEDDR